MLVDAWREVRRSYAVDLVLAGRRRAGFTEIVNSPGLILKGEVPESDLPDLYSRALAFVYPSFYEGFGLPVLEAMQCGAAVITSKDPAITEVAGGAAIQVDAGDTRGWIDALSAAVRTPERLVEWRIRSRCRAADFSWEKTARLTRRVYDEAIRRFA
jgi:glycosyltransferase involved in cell wall biosynthesis